MSEEEGGIIHDGPTAKGAVRAVCADLKGAAGDEGSTRIAVTAGEDQRSGSSLREGTGPRNRVTQGKPVGMTEEEGGIIHNGPTAKGAVRAVCTDPKGAATDGRDP